MPPRKAKSKPSAADGAAAGERRVPFGASFSKSTATAFPRNGVITSKYTLLNFLPLVTWEQLQKRANVYFIFICVLMYLGEHTPLIDSSVSWWSTASVLIPMMALSMVISGLDDLKRHKADLQTNNQRARAIHMGGNHKVFLDTMLWKDIAVGDVLVLKSEEEIPADLMPLACSGTGGQCYVSTANLDGETNLKIKAAASAAQAYLCSEDQVNGQPLLDHAVEKLATMHGEVLAEAPNKSIAKFSGSLEGLKLGSHEEAKESLSAANLLLRGTQLRNTSWLFGVVVYTGPQTRMAMNSREIPSKLANLERVVNRGMLVVLGAQFALALLSSILLVANEPRFNSYWYLFPPGTVTEEAIIVQIVMNWFKFFILYSNLMPISLYAAMEMCNFAQAYFVKSDLAMYDEEQDCPASVRSTNLCHELGQIAYIFSDKTGTLTQNVMELKRVAIAGEVFGQVTEQRGFTDCEAVSRWRQDPYGQRNVDAFCEVLSVAHTVMIATDAKGVRKFEAESPDEGALVDGARQLGWSFTDRSMDSLTVEAGAPRSYKILGVNAFNSKRKRMSTLVQGPDGVPWLLVKGADNVMIERAGQVPGWVHQYLTEFSKNGLRTLVLGRRRLDPTEMYQWVKEYEAAQCSLDDRDGKLEAVAERVELGLELLGVTGIEDKLQVGVPDTIERLREAGIQLWVLTGDKLETARNIGFSTNLLADSMDIAVLTGEEEDLADSLQVMKKQLESSRNSGMDCAMMVTGSALEQVTNGDLTEEFFEVSQVCKVVVACRVSPLQKSQLVRMVRESTDPQPVTLAIGDGANDVPMIQEAHVGVGISGKEGRQAVNAADFAIAQFRFLERLLLVHGRWDYRRTCKVILYTFWKNAIITMLLFYYTFYSGYSGTCMFTSTVWTSFSMILFFPIIATGIFDRDVTDLQAVEYPALYETGRKGLDLNLMKMIEMLLSAFVHSFVIMTVAVISFGDLDIGATGSYYSFSFMIFTWVVLTMNYRATFITTTINWIFLAALAVSFATYLLFAVVYTNVPMIFPEVYGLLMHVFGQSTFWMGSVAVPTLAMIIDIFKAYLMLEFYPDARDLILERSVKGSLSSSSLRKGHSAPRREAAELPSAGAEIIRRDCSQTAMVERSKSWNMSSNVSSSFAFSYPEGEWQPGRARPMRMPSVLDTSMLDKCVDPSRHIPAAAALPSSDSECGTSDCDEGASGNRPRNTAFAQQTIPSYQFLLNGRMVLCAATAGACLFGLMGISALLFSLNASQLRISYDGPELMERKNSWDLMGTKLVRPCQAPQECTFEITLPADIQAPVQVYYSVKPFYQNYFSYMSSVVPAELQGQMASEEARAACPEQSRLTADGKDIFPCGLIATSVFNDTFEIEGMEIDTESEHMPVWRHFKNPPEYPDKAGVSWLYERYPMVTDEELGIKSKRFVAWMIPNFLNRANKPYGVISQPLLKGQKIKMRIKSSFPVTSVGAWKTVLLTRGTQNYILVWVLLFSCGLCVALVALVWGVRQFCGRENGKARDLQGFCFRDVSDSEASTTESEA